MKKKNVSRPKTIHESGPDHGVAHREAIDECPHCECKLKYNEWDQHGFALVLHPFRRKSGHVSVVAECPDCFGLSWVHERMDGFAYGNWPEEWKKPVENLSNAENLQAIRDLGASICHKCCNLHSASVDHQAWRHCVIGTGPVVADCDRFKVIK